MTPIIPDLDLPRDDIERRQKTESILIGLRECAGDLRQAYCVIGTAIENWRKCK